MADKPDTLSETKIVVKLQNDLSDPLEIRNGARQRDALASVLTYAWETWSMSRTDENMISINQRKISRFLYGGFQENGTWRRSSNLELYQSYKESVIVNFIKIQRIKWEGHVIRMSEDRTTKKVFNV
ncbi:uncharacterized protein TNCV_3097461 [Trichonephila clavipes]|nr:uncharacterized protein TNCV_3097461 [Trichonephila clavipes]